MPRIRVMDPTGLSYEIDTRSRELLSRWFDEVLPHAFIDGRPGVDDFDVLWPRVQISPMWAWKAGTPVDPDWSCDSRALGRLVELRAAHGEQGLAELDRIRQEIEQELAGGR